MADESKIIIEKKRRVSKTAALLTPLVAKYHFEAVISCEPISKQHKEQLLEVLEMSLPLGWSRNGQTFLKLIDVLTGDIGAAEDEFVAATKSCAETHLQPGELHTLKMNFNSSTISLIDETPPPIAIVDLIPVDTAVIELPLPIDPSTAPPEMYVPPTPEIPQIPGIDYTGDLLLAEDP